MSIWRMRIACWIPKATETNSEYVILFAFPLQQWFHERASMLHYTFIALPVIILVFVQKFSPDVLFPQLFLLCLVGCFVLKHLKHSGIAWSVKFIIVFIRTRY